MFYNNKDKDKAQILWGFYNVYFYKNELFIEVQLPPIYYSVNLPRLLSFMAYDSPNLKHSLRNLSRLNNDIPDFLFEKVLFPAFLLLSLAALNAIG